MKGAGEMLRQHNVENIIMEYSPGVAERGQRYDDLIATVQMLVNIVSCVKVLMESMARQTVQHGQN